MYSRAATLCAAAALLAVAAAPAADDKPALKPGAELPGPIHPFNAANGKFVGKFHCTVCEHGLDPEVLIFAHNPEFTAKAWEPFIKDLLKGIDDYAATYPRTRLHASLVGYYDDMKDVVTDNAGRIAHADDLDKLKNSVPLQKVVLALDSLPALQKADYPLGPEAKVVVVLYDKLKVQNVYSFTKGPPDEKEAQSIVKEVREKLAPRKK
jgi:hypothetical protein